MTAPNQLVDLQSVTAIVSVKIDSQDRLRNMRLFLNYFQSFFRNFEIIVVEQDTQSRLEDLFRGARGVFHYFRESATAHSKPANLNLAASLSDRPYLLLCDVDCFVPPSGLVDGLALIQKNPALDAVLAHNGITVQIKQRLIDEGLSMQELLARLPFFSKLYEIRPPRHDPEMVEPMYGSIRIDSTVMTLYRRRTFIGAGGLNENFLGWGLEDHELRLRLQKLGYSSGKGSNVNCYHFEHSRGTDSLVNNHYHANIDELECVRSMTESELRRYIAQRFRLIQFSEDEHVTVTNSAEEYSLVANRN